MTEPIQQSYLAEMPAADRVLKYQPISSQSGRDVGVQRHIVTELVQQSYLAEVPAADCAPEILRCQLNQLLEAGKYATK